MNPTFDAPEVAAIAAPPTTPCDRCGSFASLSQMRGQMLCVGCSEKVLHVIERAPIGAGSLLTGVWEMWRVLWWRALVLVFAFELPFVVLASLAPEAPIDNISWFVTVLADGALILMVMQVIEGREVSTLGALSEVKDRWGSMIWASILSNLVTFLFLLLLIVPGVLRALSYVLILPVVLHDEGRGSDALSSSARLMQNSRSHVFVAYLVLILPTVAVLLAFFGVAVGLGVLSEDPDAAISSNPLLWSLLAPLLVVLSLIPLKLLPAVVYAKVRRTEDLF